MTTKFTSTRRFNLEAYYASLLATLPDPTYNALHPEAGWFVISGYDGDAIYYEKHHSNPVCPSISLVRRYPIDQRDKYDPLVSEISASLTCSGGFNNP